MTFLVSLTFSVMMLLLMFFQLCLMLKGNKTLLQMSPLESGFESITLSVSILSSPFVFLAVIFVLFDLEIVLLFPAIPHDSSPLILSEALFIIMFMIISLAFEWQYSGLKWQV